MDMHDDIARRNVECNEERLDLLACFLLPVLGLGREELRGNMWNYTTLGDDDVSYNDSKRNDRE